MLLLKPVFEEVSYKKKCREDQSLEDGRDLWGKLSFFNVHDTYSAHLLTLALPSYEMACAFMILVFL